MSVRIRLQRKGRSKRPYYHIVVADSRSPRDGKFIEKLGVYEPTLQPANIELDVDSAVKWLQNGAEPSETCKGILSSKGVLYKNHLINGVKKGALTVEDVEKKYSQWISEKERKLLETQQSKKKQEGTKAEDLLKQEKEINLKRAKAIAEKRAAASEKAKEVSEEVSEEAVEVVNNEVSEVVSDEVSEVANDVVAEDNTKNTQE